MVGRAEIGSGFGGKDQEFSLGCVLFKVSVSYPKISICLTWYGTGGINLEMVLKATRLDDRMT